MASLAAITWAIQQGDARAVVNYVRNVLGDADVQDSLGDTLLHVAARQNDRLEARRIEEALICQCNASFYIANSNGLTAAQFPDLGDPPNVNLPRYEQISLHCVTVLAHPPGPVVGSRRL